MRSSLSTSGKEKSAKMGLLLHQGTVFWGSVRRRRRRRRVSLKTLSKRSCLRCVKPRAQRWGQPVMIPLLKKETPGRDVTGNCSGQRNPSNAQNVGRASKGTAGSWPTCKSTPEKRCLCAHNVGRASGGRPTWWLIRESTQGRVHTSARNVREPSAMPRASLLTTKPIWERKAFPAERTSVGTRLCCSIRESMWMRSPVGVQSMEITSVWAQTSSHTNTWERDPVNTQQVTELSCGYFKLCRISGDTWNTLVSVSS